MGSSGGLSGLGAVLQGPGKTAVPALAAVALVPCSLGLIKPGYAISLGYGVGVGAIGAAVLACGGVKTTPALIHAVGTTAYGVRLFGHLWTRMKRVPDLHSGKAWEKPTKAKDVLKRFPLVVSCSGLYALMCSPVLFAARTPPPANLLPLTYAALGLQAAGLCIEAVADWQKSKSKGRYRSGFVSTGLYEKSRHPNYLGEQMFWAGLFLAGVPSMTHWGQFVASGMGLASIQGIMVGATKRLEKKQLDKYGGQDAYKEYLKRSNALLPKLS